MAKDFYGVLWLEKTATQEEIKKAYRKLAMEYHPDRNQGDADAEAKFKQVNEAYGTLWDSSKRQQYDMFGSSGGGMWWNPFWGWFQAEDISDIFSSFFGGGSRRQTERRGEDLEYDLHIDFKTSIYGWKDEIEFHTRTHCENCEWAWGQWKKTCSTCNGRWQVTQTSQSPFWVIQQTRACSDCQGSGEIFETLCSECQGEKRILKKQKLGIDIPAGIDDGMVIKLTGEWNAGINSQASWDLFVRFHVPSEEKWLTRDGVDLHYDLEIDLVEALLWTKKDILFPVIWKRSISIEAWTQAESVLKIKGDGVKYIDRDIKWDLLVHIHIPIPKKLSKKERDLYQEIAKEKKINVNSKKGVFEKIFS